MIFFEDGYQTKVPRDYICRVDSIANIESIAEVGLRCGPATRMGKWGNSPDAMPETDSARQAGLRVPEDELLHKPRLFFFLELEPALVLQRTFNRTNRLSRMPRDVILRFSRRAPALRDDHLFFVDGACGPKERAVYVVCPGANVGDSVVESCFIEIRLSNGTWMSLLDYVARRKVNRARRAEKAALQKAERSKPTPPPPQFGGRRWLRKLLDFIS